MSTNTPEQRAIWDARYREKQIAKWHAENGPDLPLCACGCGESVKFGPNGRLPKYAGKNHHVRVKGLPSKALTQYHEDRREAQNAVPIEKFRESALNAKKRLGLTWAELAQRGGWSKGMLNYYMFDKRPKALGRHMAEAFFRRIMGMPVLPTREQQLKHARLMVNREKTLERDYIDNH